MGGYFHAISCRTLRLEMKRPRRMSLLSERRRDSADAPELCCRSGLCVCALGVVLLNVADSNAHADGGAEMPSVSKVPLAA